MCIHAQAPINAYDGDPTKIMTTCIDPVDILNCWHYKSPTECLHCINGYYPNPTADTCIKAPVEIPGCLSYDTAGCVRCDPTKYYLDTTTQKCVLLPTTFTLVDHCGAYSGASSTTVACSYCTTGYALNTAKTQCVSIGSVIPIDGCVYYSGSNTCAVCEPTYYLNNGQCSSPPANIANCRTFSAAGVCAVCNANYVATATGSACILVEDPNCVAHTTTLLCAVCNSGSYPDGSGACIADATKPGTTHCAVYDATQKCTQCDPAYYINSSNVCVLRPVGDPNCSIYVNNVCTACTNGNYLKPDNTCAAGGVSDCAQYATSSSTSCLKCNTGFVPSTDNTKCLANCITPLDATQCKYCAAGYKPVAGVCQTNTVTSCVVQDSAGKCLYCDSTTVLNPVTGACVAPTSPVTGTCNI